MRLLGEPLDTIWKFNLPSGEDFAIQMPKGSIPLSVGIDPNVRHFTQSVVWCAVNSHTEEREMYRFHLRGTGHPFPELLLNRFVGTFQTPGFGLVFHLFDGGPEQEPA